MERAAVAAAGVDLQVVGHTGRWRLTPYPGSGNREWTLVTRIAGAGTRRMRMDLSFADR